jgi:MATE family multidrug resistance protein
MPASADRELAAPGIASAGPREVVRLGIPAIFAFLTANCFRVNDQFWVQGLGPDAQAAIGASFFVLLLNSGLYFVVVGGMLPLVARATGAGDSAGRERAIAHALLLASLLAVALTIFGTAFADRIPRWLGMEPAVAAFATEYLSTMFRFCLPMALGPVVDHVFLGMGNTRVPMFLQAIAVGTSVVLEPALIRGWGPLPAFGISGAALATALSRALSVTLGLTILHAGFAVRWTRGLALSMPLVLRVLRVGMFSSLSILIHSSVYLVLFRIVLAPLGRDAMAGFSIGFNAFEGVSFPFYLGIAMAGSSLVGRSLGAGSERLALRAVRSVRIVGASLGLAFAALFLLAGPGLVPAFASDAAVAREATLYVRTLALSQVFVALEAVNEKALLGAGHTAPIFWISVPVNLLRIPLAWLFALELGWGPAGVWWAINLTSFAKASAYQWCVDRRAWLSAAGFSGRDRAPARDR